MVGTERSNENPKACISMPAMPWRHSFQLFTYVIAITEEASISGAARRLNLSQPTLSRQLRDLEQRLGASLFTRTGRSLTPTAAGQAFVRRARRVVAEAEGALDDVHLAAQGLTGRLTITFAGSGINGPLGRALGRLRMELPDVDLRLVELFDDIEMSSGVLTGDFDVAVQRLPVYDPRLVTSEWIREPLTLYLPAAHPLASVGGEAPLSVLDGLPLVLWPRESTPRAYDEIIALYHRNGMVPRIAAAGRTVQTILTLVAAGFGAAIMADSYRVLHREGVIARPLAGATTKLYVVCRSGELDPLLTKFWSVLRGTSRTPEAASYGPRT